MTKSCLHTVHRVKAWINCNRTTQSL